MSYQISIQHDKMSGPILTALPVPSIQITPLAMMYRQRAKCVNCGHSEATHNAKTEEIEVKEEAEENNFNAYKFNDIFYYNHVVYNDMNVYGSAASTSTYQNTNEYGNLHNTDSIIAYLKDGMFEDE